MAFIKTVLTGLENVDRKVVIEDSDADAENDITGVQTSVIHSVEIDCTENPGEDVTTRFYASAAPTVGSTVAEMILPGVAGQVVKFVDIETLADFDKTGENPDISGNANKANISVATVKNPGTTLGADPPSGKVKVTIWYKE